MPYVVRVSAPTPWLVGLHESGCSWTADPLKSDRRVHSVIDVLVRSCRGDVRRAHLMAQLVSADRPLMWQSFRPPELGCKVVVTAPYMGDLRGRFQDGTVWLSWYDRPAHARVFPTPDAALRVMSDAPTVCQAFRALAVQVDVLDAAYALLGGS